MKMKKLGALLMATLITVGMMTACTPETEGGGETTGGVPERTYTGKEKTLKVLNYNGGFGEAWLEWTKYRFEEEYKDLAFEAEGKVGVKIEIDSDKDGYYGQGLMDRMPTVNHDVFFSESIKYTTWISSNYMMDITDVVTELNLDNKTIESKMSAEQKAALKVDGAYYCVPHYAAFTGINYDIDLFDAKKLYYKKNCAPSEENFSGTVAYTNLAGARSAGPDGEYNTYDDGLPATYDEFFALCGYMKNTLSITPFTWTGGYIDTYTNWILSALAADYEGKEQMMLNYNFEGTAKNLATIEGTGADARIVLDTEDTVIEAANGYELYRSAGRYYALEFFEQIVDGNYYHTDGFGDASAIAAQATYLRSRQQSDKDDVAFLLEGNWWENEADDATTFSTMAKRYGDKWARENRRFGMMPLPKATADKIGEKATLVDNNLSYAFIRKNISPNNVELAKLFLKYCYTDAELQSFTEVVGAPKALTYEMPEDTAWKSAYSKNVWDLYANADKVYPISNSTLYLRHQSDFVYFETFVTSDEKHAVQSLNRGYTSEDYFKGISGFKNATWWQNTMMKGL